MGAFPSATLDSVWTLPFGLTFDQAILDPSALNYDLHVDTSTNFASPNAVRVTKTSSGLVNFQEGNGVGKAFEIAMPGRALRGDVVWYWRVRINSGAFLSPWSDVRAFTVPQRQDLAQAQQAYDRLADGNSYDKEANSANTYKVVLQVGRELDLLLWENQQSTWDLYLDSARDAALVNNFSSYLGLQRSAADVASNHRWRTKRLWKAFTNYPGTLQGLLDSVMAFVAEPPAVADITSTQGWILDQNYIGIPGNNSVSPVIVIYARPQRGNAFSLTIFNSWNLAYDQRVIERFIKRMKPAHAQMTLQYSPVRHWSARFNRQADWALWSADANADLTTYADSVAIVAGQTSTTLVSPVLGVPTASGYNFPLIATTLSGQAVSLFYQTSQDGQSFSAYAQLVNGTVPDSSIPIGPFVRFKAVLSRTSTAAPTPILNSLEFQGTRS